jgi:hypothetical protein
MIAHERRGFSADHVREGGQVSKPLQGAHPHVYGSENDTIKKALVRSLRRVCVPDHALISEFANQLGHSS